MQESLQNREKEVQSFKSRFEQEVDEKENIKDQLDKVGRELTDQLDIERKEHDSTKVIAFLLILF